MALVALAPESISTALPSPKSKREQEVAAMIADCQANRQIAATQSISERTVERRVANILNKLGLNTRAQVAAWVVEQRLTARPSGA